MVSSIAAPFVVSTARAARAGERAASCARGSHASAPCAPYVTSTPVFWSHPYTAALCTHTCTCNMKIPGSVQPPASACVHVQRACSPRAAHWWFSRLPACSHPRCICGRSTFARYHDFHDSPRYTGMCVSLAAAARAYPSSLGKSSCHRGPRRAPQHSGSSPACGAVRALPCGKGSRSRGRGCRSS